MNESLQPLIQLAGVGKSYPLVQKGGHQLAQVWSRLRGTEPSHVFKALQDISFDVYPGQSVGLVGVNSAGKSTLLKLIAGVVKPTTGRLERSGRIGALLELGAGFHPDYTGRDNVFLACALMGLSHAETQDRIEGILAFADIGEHIDQPIKHYSSGMVVRLGFAVATSMVPDVLITDEVLAVGDESFQKKCIAWMESFLTQGGTLLLCSHSMYHIQKLCQRAVWIDRGRMVMQSDATEVTRSYLAWHEEKDAKHALVQSKEANSGHYHIQNWWINGVVPSDGIRLAMGEDLTVAGILYSPDARVPQISVGLVRIDGTPVYGVVSEMDGHVLSKRVDGLFEFRIEFSALPLLPGHYRVRAHAMDPEGIRLFDHVESNLEITGDARELGLCRLTHRWR